MGQLKTAFDILGYASSIVVVIACVYGLISWVRGISPALIRLGRGLANRNIAIFAEGDHSRELANVLLDSKLFRPGNLIEITSISEIGRADRATVFLIHWHDWHDHLDEVLAKKSDTTALIIYAPQSGGPIASEQIGRINEVRNATVTNFRGRLLSDIVLAMITTSYD